MASNDKATPPDRAKALAEIVYGCYQQHLHRFLMRRLRSDQDARDLAQEVYLRLLRVEDTSQISEPLAYAYRTAANVVTEFQMRRRRERERVYFDSETLERQGEHPAELQPDELADRLGNERMLLRALRRLPPLYRTVLLMRLRDGQDYPEIAARLRLSAHTVKRYFFRAVGKLRVASERT